MPGVRTPLVVMSVSKRRWLVSLKSAAFDRNRISGAVFSDRTIFDRVFSFHMVYQREKGGATRWSADNAFWRSGAHLAFPRALMELPDSEWRRQSV